MNPQFLTAQQAAEYLSLSTRTLRAMVADGRLPGYRVGTKCLRFKVEDLDALVRRIGG